MSIQNFFLLDDLHWKSKEIINDHYSQVHADTELWYMLSRLVISQIDYYLH